MKNALLIVAMMFGLLQPGRASGVVGKWYCSQAFLDSLYLSAVCNEYKGIFEFRNDGTFRLNVSGSTMFPLCAARGLAVRLARLAAAQSTSGSVAVTVWRAA